MANANDEIVVMAMIETKEGLANLDAICATPGLDAVYIGPADLSFALGMPPRHILGQVLAESLRRFKQVIETGEVATTAGQPNGLRRRRAAPAEAARRAANVAAMLRRSAGGEVRP